MNDVNFHFIFRGSAKRCVLALGLWCAMFSVPSISLGQACCEGTSCSIQPNKEACDVLGGFFKLGSYICLPNPCLTGACCHRDGCESNGVLGDITPAACGLFLDPVYIGGAICSGLVMPGCTPNPPEIVFDLELDVDLQAIAFIAQNPTGETGTFDWEISSSSSQTTFDQPLMGTSIGPGAEGQTWNITPGAAALGEIHTFTLTLINDNPGRTITTVDLQVVPLGSNSTVLAGPTTKYVVAKVPTTSTWGIVAIFLSMLAAGSILVRRLNVKQCNTMI